MQSSRAIRFGLAALMLVTGIARASDEYMLKLSDGTSVRVMSDAEAAKRKAGLDARYAAKFPYALAELSSQYVYAFAAQGQIAARATVHGALPKERSLPMGGFDVAMNGTDLALRAAGSGPILPFSKTFQWTGIGLGLAGMLLSMGKTNDDLNVDLLKAEMNWYNLGPNLQIKVVEEIAKTDERLKDKTALQLAHLEAIEKVLLAAGLQDASKPSSDVTVYPGVRLEARTPAKGFQKSDVLINSFFAHPKSVWMAGKTESEILVTTIFPPMFAQPERRIQHLEEARVALATHAPDNWYWIWTDQVGDKTAAHVASIDRQSDFDPPPRGEKYKDWLKELAQTASDGQGVTGN